MISLQGFYIRTRCFILRIDLTRECICYKDSLSLFFFGLSLFLFIFPSAARANAAVPATPYEKTVYTPSDFDETLIRMAKNGVNVKNELVDVKARQEAVREQGFIFVDEHVQIDRKLSQTTYQVANTVDIQTEHVATTYTDRYRMRPEQNWLERATLTFWLRRPVLLRMILQILTFA